MNSWQFLKQFTINSEQLTVNSCQLTVSSIQLAVFSVRLEVESTIVSSSEMPVGVLYRELLKGMNSKQLAVFKTIYN